MQRQLLTERTIYTELQHALTYHEVDVYLMWSVGTDSDVWYASLSTRDQT